MSVKSFFYLRIYASQTKTAALQHTCDARLYLNEIAKYIDEHIPKTTN